MIEVFGNEDDFADPNWVPLLAALKWVMTRDSYEFAEAMTGKRDSFRQSEFDEAWLAIRVVIAAGALKARGRPYQEEIALTPEMKNTVEREQLEAARTRRARWLETNKINEVEDEEEEEEDTLEEYKDVVIMNDPLPPELVNSLVLDVHNELLRPSTWALSGGVGWRSIVISRSDLMATFPVEEMASGDDTLLSEAEIKVRIPARDSRYLRNAAKAAIRKYFPNGFPDGLPAPERNVQINVRVKEIIEEMFAAEAFKGIPRDKIKFEASAPVIRQALRELKIT